MARPVEQAGLYSNGELNAFCWCTRKIIRVHKTIITAGETLSCGHEDCNKENVGDVSNIIEGKRGRPRKF